MMPASRARMKPKTCACGKVCANALHLAKHHKRECAFIPAPRIDAADDADALIGAGFAERGADGVVRLTPAGYAWRTARATQPVTEEKP